MNDEQFRILCLKLKESDAQNRTIIQLINKLQVSVDRVSQRMSLMRSNYAVALRRSRKHEAELLAKNIELKQQIAELLKFQ